MLKTLRNLLLAAVIISRISSVVSPIVIVSIVSESGIGVNCFGVVIDDSAAYLGDDQSITSVGVTFIELTLCELRMTGSADVLTIGILP